MNKIPITVIIPVKNEEKNLPECLNRLSLFSQIFVVDSSSTDSTPEIAKKNEVEYINFKWNGKFPKKRNWALRNLEIKNDWVLFLDADEYVSKEFIMEINRKIKNAKYNGFRIQFRNIFMGKKLRYGDKMRKLPLFRKNKGEYEMINENLWTELDMEIHEHPIIEGNIGQINTPVIHNDYNGLERYISKHNKYSTWEAKRYLLLKESGFQKLTFRQKMKYFFINSGLLPLLYFVGSYIFKLGFLDGQIGFVFAVYKANYFFQIRTKIKEKNQTNSK